MMLAALLASMDVFAGHEPQNLSLLFRCFLFTHANKKGQGRKDDHQDLKYTYHISHLFRI